MFIAAAVRVSLLEYFATAATVGGLGKYQQIIQLCALAAAEMALWIAA